MPDPRANYIRLVEEAYFGNLMRDDIDGALACFSDTAVVTIRHGDATPRIFHRRPTAGEAALEDFFRHLLGQFHASFGEFHHYFDPVAGGGASRFVVSLKPRATRTDLQPQQLLNCNFFDLEEGRIERMLIYYANPGAGSAAPTGYPT